MSADTLRARRQDLRDAIWTAGPEHFDMTLWFAQTTECGDRHDAALWQTGAIDITACGTTACIWGHGALIMAAAGETISNDHLEASGQVAAYFGLPAHEDGFADLTSKRFWRNVPFGDGTLADHRATVDNDWTAVLDYLDALIKGES